MESATRTDGGARVLVGGSRRRGEMKTYLEQEFGWPEVRWYGRVRRRRALLHSGEWSTKEVMAIYGETGGLDPTPQQLSQWVRGHWEIESGVFWVLDVTYQDAQTEAWPGWAFVRALISPGERTCRLASCPKCGKISSQIRRGVPAPLMSDRWRDRTACR